MKPKAELKMGRSEKLRERFAARGGGVMARGCVTVAKAMGVHCATRSDVEPKVRLRAKAGKKLARAGWMGFPNSHNPHGPLTDGQLALWIGRTSARQKAIFKLRRAMRDTALTKIAEQLPAKLPKLPAKYRWQKP